MTRFARPLLAVCVAIALSGCGLIYRPDVQQGNLLTKQLVDQLKPGMSKRQVSLLLGTPSITSPFERDRWDYVSSIQRRGGKIDTKNLTLTFENEALARIEGDYFPENAEQLIKDAKKYRIEFPDEKRPGQDKKKRRG
ncbi:outer membrane protein assembly factor BamE [Tahibacter amnicola]|uniref:Outer membrane protein assembly factor BamE n=1 Tax=Tahibacter amnicola TaxID=2976241 RepID=A0ABY6B8S7_9GAMM|nr:outer membrane protein assembly factor BamE [Tahibacter amnicola]UXI66424.1 outer membrane protein assembly factor BamE [Tahibacter amnicola]